MPAETTDKRVQFDFEIDFSNGGGIQGQGFRLDIDGDDIADTALADYIVRDLRLLMVGAVRILNKTIIHERHKRAAASAQAAPRAAAAARHIDLSHAIEDGMITYRGLPAPIVCDHLSRAQSRAHYAEGTEFQIGKITMVANTGTYIDSPYHRYADGKDVAGFDLDEVAGLDGVLARVAGMAGRAIGRSVFLPLDVRGKAVLVHTGWDRHWRTDRYFEGHPFLTADAAAYLRDAGARLVGIDSLNIDDTADGHRPVHTALLGAGIPIVEHLCGLDQLPTAGFRFSAVPVKVKGMGTFPVRAYATLEAT
ncbi:MAG: cyclase family protein [Mizugakiibacter sp.]|uniref:cyclase family protein n=1 Tax=Mizugakiibacter sp. TaxID=1972610 RepID=UPI0031C3A6B4|nr:cyclase family protein [Xanthomonadaceae bacterium]